MPIAKGGDLSATGRLNLYTDSINAVLQVAKQIATALRAAHTVNIVHRDVKPKNILFTGNGHETWLSDFGICLIREAPRITETPEIVGPRAFMAPELEEGGQLDVTPAADIYSLGKVIYYMHSGGVTLPRERLDEQQFRKIFEKGERHRLLELLLRRMICSIELRIASAEEILRELEKIGAWEQNARLLPISEAALSGIEQLQRRSLDAGRIAAENKQARNQETQTLGTVQRSLSDWLMGELRKFVPLISSDSIRCEVQEASMPASPQFIVQTGYNSAYAALSGVELTFDDIHDPSNRKHALQFFLCRHSKALVTVTEGRGIPTLMAQPAQDIQLAVLPFYRQTLKHQHPSISPVMGYLSPISSVGTVRGRLNMPSLGQRQGPRVSHERVQLISRSFDHGLNLHVDFRASEWLGNVDKIRTVLKDSIDTFITFINSGTGA